MTPAIADPVIAATATMPEVAAESPEAICIEV